MGIVLDGKWLARCIEAELKDKVSALGSKRRPTLATILVGDDPASKTYVASKHRAAERCGFRAIDRTLSSHANEASVVETIRELNDDNSVDGILLQLPLPKGMDTIDMISHISVDKDVDGLHPNNQGKLIVGARGPIPCTPAGVMTLIDAYFAGVSWGSSLIKTAELPLANLAGKRALVIGRSVLVGKPLALLLLERNATVTIAHSKTNDLQGEIHRADIIIPAVGRPELVKREWCRNDAVIIDVGINRIADGSLVGDVSKQGAIPDQGALAPVPGGVGPMTVASLLRNTWQLYCATSLKGS